MNIKRNIIFALESRNKDGVPILENVPIRMRVNFASQRVEFTTAYRIDVAKRDVDKQIVKNGCVDKLKKSASEINTALLGYYAELQEVLKRFEVPEIMSSTAEVKEAFSNRYNQNEETERKSSDTSNVPSNFYDAFDDFVRVRGRQNDWTHFPFEKFSAVKNNLKSFRAELSFLKWFLCWSFKQGLYSNNAYDSFKPKLKDTQKKIIFLTWEELNRLREFKLPATKQALERVRDVFLFQCFTGLRYSDVYNLRRSDIKANAISKLNQL